MECKKLGAGFELLLPFQFPTMIIITSRVPPAVVDLGGGQHFDLVCPWPLAYTGWNDKIVVLKKTFIEKINSGNLIM